MTIRFLPSFVKDYAKLPEKQQKKVDKQLRLLAEDVKHSGLYARKMVNSEVWEARVDYHYRMTFTISQNIAIMRRVDTHRIYRKP